MEMVDTWAISIVVDNIPLFSIGGKDWSNGLLSSFAPL
jgi:hypothetical protein